MANDIFFNSPKSSSKKSSNSANTENDFDLLQPESINNFKNYYNPKNTGSTRASSAKTADNSSKQRTNAADTVNQSNYSPAKSKKIQTEKAYPENEKKPLGDGKKKQKNAKKTGKPAKVLCILLAVILTLAVFTGGAGLYVLGDYKPFDYDADNSADSSSLMHSAGVTNILLMGVDNADTSLSTRSDSMIVLSIDSVHSKLKLTSFMRDMYVNVPGYGYTKLTHACAYEGPQLVADTIETNFNIKIDAYAKIGYDSFVTLVDGVGGITVSEIDSTEAAALKREYVSIEPGTNIHLNGYEALQYCRIRKGQSDFQRTERQREAITLIVNKLKHTNPFKLIKLAKTLVAEVECSIPKAELIKLAFKALPSLIGKVEQAQIPIDGSWANDTRDGLAVLVVDLDENINFLKEFIY